MFPSILDLDRLSSGSRNGDAYVLEAKLVSGLKWQANVAGDTNQLPRREI
jgi:hypothetical protein